VLVSLFHGVVKARLGIQKEKELAPYSGVYDLVDAWERRKVFSNMPC
jgi:hypothetical protein